MAARRAATAVLPISERMAAGPPSGEQLASLQRLRLRLKRFSLVNVGVLAIAVLAMATARYLVL